MCLQRPAEPWELVQLGNCGSPLETPAGWIMLTHGVHGDNLVLPYGRADANVGVAVVSVQQLLDQLT